MEKVQLEKNNITYLALKRWETEFIKRAIDSLDVKSTIDLIEFFSLSDFLERNRSTTTPSTTIQGLS